jgi:transcriptional regulator with XRE-family HTH domain
MKIKDQPPVDYTKIVTGKDVQRLRLQLGMSQRKLGEALGISHGTVCTWERRNKLSSAAAKLIYEFGVSTLVQRQENEKQKRIFDARKACNFWNIFNDGEDVHITNCAKKVVDQFLEISGISHGFIEEFDKLSEQSNVIANKDNEAELQEWIQEWVTKETCGVDWLSGVFFNDDILLEELLDQEEKEYYESLCVEFLNNSLCKQIQCYSKAKQAESYPMDALRYQFLKKNFGGIICDLYKKISLLAAFESTPKNLDELIDLLRNRPEEDIF